MGFSWPQLHIEPKADPKQSHQNRAGNPGKAWAPQEPLHLYHPGHTDVALNYSSGPPPSRPLFCPGCLEKRSPRINHSEVLSKSHFFARGILRWKTEQNVPVKWVNSEQKHSLYLVAFPSPDTCRTVCPSLGFSSSISEDMAIMYISGMPWNRSEEILSLLREN